MKKQLAFIIIGLLVFSMALTGCTPAPAAPAAPAATEANAVATEAAPAPANLIMATGGTSGTYYPFGGAMAQIFNSKIAGMNVTAQSTGASVENLKLIGKKEVELAIVQNDTTDYALKGIEVFADGKIENVRAIASLYPEVIQIVVSKKSGIMSLADIKGKKFSVGAPGSGVEANARQILDVIGLTYKDFTPNYLSFSESADQYKDNLIDGFLFTSGIPNSAIQDVGAQNELTFLSIDDATVSALTAKYEFLTAYTIPAGTYPGQDADVKTVSVKAILVCGADVSEEAVYNITKALFEFQPELASAHAKGKLLDINNSTDGISIEFHPGAAKYLTEKGILK